MLAENRILFPIAKYFSKTVTIQPICIQVYTEIYKCKKHFCVSIFENYPYFHSKTWKKYISIDIKKFSKKTYSNEHLIFLL